MSEPPAESPVGYNLAYLHAPGVQFIPSDQELIVFYLQRKLRGEPPLYAGAVNDDDGINVYSEHPKDLVRKLSKSFRGTWYLFSRRLRRYGNGVRPKRGTDDEVGFWKTMTARKDVYANDDGNKEVTGHKCGLTYNVFVEPPPLPGEPKRKRKYEPTKWKMEEFISADSNRPPDKTAPNPMLLNDYVLCKITNKKFDFEVDDEEQDHAGLPQATEEEPGAKSQVQQQEALIEGDRDTAAAVEALLQAGPGDFALCANANTLDDDYGLPWDEFAEPLNWSTGYLNNNVTPYSFSELDYYIKTDDFAGESQPAEQQQVTSVGGAGWPQQQATAEATNNTETTATAAEGTAPVLPTNTLAMPGDYDWETGDLPDWDDL